MGIQQTVLILLQFLFIALCIVMFVYYITIVNTPNEVSKDNIIANAVLG
jgi:hypothetical protein